MTAFVVYAVYRRSAGTTLYDAAVILTSQAAIALAMLSSTRSVRRYIVSVGCSTFIVSLFSFNFNYNVYRTGMALYNGYSATSLGKSIQPRAKYAAPGCYSFRTIAIGGRGLKN